MNENIKEIKEVKENEIIETKKTRNNTNHLSFKSIKLKDFIWGLLLLVVTCLYPCMYMYFQNIAEVKFSSVFPPFALFFVAGLIVFIITVLFYLDVKKAALFSAVSLMFLINFMVIYNLICSVMITVSYWTFLCIIGVLLFAFLVFLKIKKMDTETINQVITLVLSGLIVFNFLTAIPNIINMNKDITKFEVPQYAVDRSNKNNVYFLIFDEYGGYENLKYYFNYDNSEFLDFLEDEGFSVSKTSHNVEAIETKDIIPNILNLDYVAKEGDPINSELTTDTVLHRFYEDMGYQINLINHYNTFRYEDNYNLLSDYMNGEIDDPDYVFKKKIYSNSILYPVYDSVSKSDGKDPVNQAELDATNIVLDDSYRMSEETNGKPTFTLVYMMLPHSPFLYNEDGSTNTQGTSDWNNKDLYLNQLKYFNTCIKKMVLNVKENDPDATIVLMSDHGCRLAGHLMKDYKKSEYDAGKETYMMQNVLNCVYLGTGEKIDIEGLSGVNTWRLILNTLYGTNYEMLDEPERFIYKWKYVDGFQM